MKSLLLLLVVIGVAYGAWVSAPGSFLYPVKLKVLEPVPFIFAIAVTDRTAWSAELIGRRIDEAVMLANKQMLNTDLLTDLEKGMDKQIAYVQKWATGFTEKKEYAQAIDAITRLSAVLETRMAYAQTNLIPPLTDEKVKLLVGIADRRNSLYNSRQTLNAQFMEETLGFDAQVASIRKTTEVTALLEKIQSGVTAKKERLGAEAVKSIQDVLDSGRSIMSDAKALSTTDRFNESFLKAQDAYVLAEHARLLLRNL